MADLSDDDVERIARRLAEVIADPTRRITSEQVAVLVVKESGDWMFSPQVARHFKVALRTLQRWMKDSDVAGLERVWQKQGRLVRWDPARVDKWAMELSEWRASQSAETASISAGAPSTAAPGGFSAPRTRSPRPSRRSRKKQPPSGETGSLLRQRLKDRLSR